MMLVHITFRIYLLVSKYVVVSIHEAAYSTEGFGAPCLYQDSMFYVQL